MEKVSNNHPCPQLSDTDGNSSDTDGNSICCLQKTQPETVRLI
jgi:hypothetical protein